MSMATTREQICKFEDARLPRLIEAYEIADKIINSKIHLNEEFKEP